MPKTRAGEVVPFMSGTQNFDVYLGVLSAADKEARVSEVLTRYLTAPTLSACE